MGSTIVSILNGLSYGMILFLIAAGLSLIMGVMQFLNLAHGALFMLGGYIGWTVAVEHGAGFWVAVLVAGLAIALIGFVMERLLLRRLHDQLDNQVLATLGITYIITNLTIWIWSAQPKVAFVPSSFEGSLTIAGESYPTSRIAVLGAGAIVAVALWWFQDRTRMGAMVRAGMDDRETASSLGVNVGAVSAIVFTVGCFVAGLSGVLGQQLTGLQPGQGTSVLLLALVVLVLGGIGTVQGALLGALLIGLVNSFGQLLFPDLAAFTIYAAMILVLVVRPGGLLGRPEALRI
jgi:branched-chain amino acid transport system permease protein